MNDKCKKRKSFINDDEPSKTLYYDNNNIAAEMYYANGYLHRENGPARITYNEDGTIQRKRYYLQNKEYSEFEYYVLMGSCK